MAALQDLTNAVEVDVEDGRSRDTVDLENEPSTPSSSDYEASSEDSASLLTPCPPLKKRKLRKTATVKFGQVAPRHLRFASSSSDEEAQDGFTSEDEPLPDLVPSEDEEASHPQVLSVNNGANSSGSGRNGGDDQEDQGNNPHGNSGSKPPCPFSFYDDLEMNIGHDRNLYVSSDGTYVRFALRNAANVEIFRKRVHLSLKKWKVFVEALPDIDEAVKKLVHGEDVNYFLHIGNKIHVSIKSGIFCIDIRKYWFPQGKTELVHGLPAVSLKLKEFGNLRDRLEEINSFVHLERVRGCKHSTEQEKLACEDCTVVR